ncbi:hypothetical protein [Vibrio navarrensis]|uniref:hypothetical protein n=1 Tax=Vibrio navarrensis TaxID=29495 RepID=UPI002094A467|nr:hypothetical protein [Vibrio navarrensis]
MRIPLKQFVSLNFSTLDLPSLRLNRFGKPTNHLSFESRIGSKFVAFHAIWKPENFNKSLSENSKRMQNFQSDFTPLWLTSSNPKIQLRQQLKTRIDKQCRFAEKPEQIAKGKKRPQPTDF